MSKEAAVKAVPRSQMNHERTNEDGQAVDDQGRVIVKANRREPVLIMNEPGSFKYVPREIAEVMEKKGTAVILTARDPNYVESVKLAIGRWDGWKQGEVIQVKGKPVEPKDIGKFDSDTLVADAEAAVKALTGEDGKIIPVESLEAAGLDAFVAKKRERFMDKH